MYKTERTTNNVAIDTSVADTAPPTITVAPPSGTKVKNGQRLTIRVTATEPSIGWQAGVKQIQIEDLDRHTNLAPWDNPAPAPRPCGNTGLTHTIERNYVVPPDVPVAHLKITARDYHNPQQALLVEYPTGDWYGWVTWSETVRNVPTIKPSRYWGRLDFTVNYDGRGNLTGRMVGIEDFETSNTRESVARGGLLCEAKTNKPTHLEVPLLGQYTAGRNTISLSVDPLATKYIIGELSYDCPVTPSHQFGRLDAAIRPELNDIMRDIALTNERDAEVTREWNPASNGIGMLKLKLTLRRARN